MANAALKANPRPLNKLSAEAVAQFRRDGFYSPIRAMPASEAIAIRTKLEAHEKRAGGPLKGALRHKSHLLFPWLWDLVHTAASSTRWKTSSARTCCAGLRAFSSRKRATPRSFLGTRTPPIGAFLHPMW